VLNSKPTICLRDLIEDKTVSITLENVLAAIMFQFNILYNQMMDFESCDIFAPFLSRYYKYWLHSYITLIFRNQPVTILEQDGVECQGVIVGLSKTGLLRAVKNNAEEILLQPDGNSFDMLKGLIRSKES
jgi:biotin--protein ligase